MKVSGGDFQRETLAGGFPKISSQYMTLEKYTYKENSLVYLAFGINFCGSLPRVVSLYFDSNIKGLLSYM